MADGAKQGGVERAKQTRAIIITGAVVVAALVGVIVALVMNLNRSQPEPAPDRELRSVVVNEDNAEEVFERMMSEEPVTAGFYEAKMTMTWNFPDGLSASPNAYVENVPNNSNDVYFDLSLRDTGEIIYESPVIPLGSHLDGITLNRDLDAGSYSCVVTYYLVDAEQNVVDSLRMGVRVIVES